ncbi:unnamed protein product [Allacma fusca]|uniref:Uncharacterized protein n=1 Tax=Allacma fusca TaxID=39272 RepID=A0A8J2NT92_9HEXA|nr:unnamed protein product [Allacma fusca]
MKTSVICQKVVINGVHGIRGYLGADGPSTRMEQSNGSHGVWTGLDRPLSELGHGGDPRGDLERYKDTMH